MDAIQGMIDQNRHVMLVALASSNCVPNEKGSRIFTRSKYIVEMVTFQKLVAGNSQILPDFQVLDPNSLSFSIRVWNSTMRALFH